MNESPSPVPPEGRRRFSAPLRTNRQSSGVARDVARTVFAYLQVVIVTIVGTTLGTLTHRDPYHPFRRLALVLLAMAVLALYLRVIAGRRGVVLALVLAAGVLLILTYCGPGGDVLVPNDKLSYSWLGGCPAIMVLVGLGARERWIDPEGEDR